MSIDPDVIREQIKDLGLTPDELDTIINAYDEIGKTFSHYYQ